MDISRERGQDAKQLADETYHDVMKVLQEKSAKARKIAQESKENVKEKGSS